MKRKFDKEVRRVWDRNYRKKYPEKVRENSKKYYHKNKERIAARRYGYSLKNAYGMSISEYNSILENQNGRCAICVVGKINFVLIMTTQLEKLEDYSVFIVIQY